MKKIFAAILSAVLAMAVCLFAGCEKKPATPVTPPPATGDEKPPFYVENADTLEYGYSEEERIIPFWQSNVMRNEQLMIVEKDGVTQGKLLYEPTRVISVRDWTLEREYVEGVDYEINGNVITLPEGSSIPVFKDEWSRGENIPEQYPFGNAGSGWAWAGGGVMYTESALIWQNYIHVTYVYDNADADKSVFAKYSGELYGLEQKIKSDDPEDKKLKMVVFGDSISEGHSSSEIWNHAPKSPPYAKLVAYGLEHFGGLDVEYTNMSVGGKDSSWAADEAVDPELGKQLPKLQNLAPDLLILAFGTNDSGNNLSGKAYRRNLETVIQTAKAANSECQILLVAPFPSHEKSQPGANIRLMIDAQKAIVQETEYFDVAHVSMYEPCKKMLETKNYYEIAGNNVNHPNDFIHRVYAMNILSAMLDFENL